MAAQKGVVRLASLYGMMERLRSVELRAAAGAVEDVACSAAIAADVREGQIMDARTAMATGSREEWQVAETTRGVVEARIERLEKLRAERAAAFEDAAHRHRISRVKMEQMDRVVDRSRAREAVQQGRRSQAESDDRFASRRAWMKVQQVESSE